MDQLLKLKDSLVSFLSPSANRRRSVMAVSTPDGRLTSLQRPLHHTSEPRIKKEKAVTGGRVSKKYLSPSDTQRFLRRSFRKSKRHKDSDDEYKGEVDDELQSSTHPTKSELSPDDSASQITPRSERATSPIILAESEEDLDLDSDEESQLEAEAKVYQFLDRQTELSRIQGTLNRIRAEEWHEDEVALFQKLNMRGFEPLLPSTWSFDFRTCPEIIFSSDDEETFINSASGNDFRGIYPHWDYGKT